MTREQLAEICADMGEPGLTAEVILNIEGRRVRGETRYREVNSWELMVIARSLEVAPLLLLFPVGQVDTVPVPGPADPDNGRSATTLTAARWFSGEIQDSPDLTADNLDSHGRGELDADSGLYEWYETPNNFSGVLGDFRRVVRYQGQWAAMASLVRKFGKLIQQAETESGRDILRVAALAAWESSEGYWGRMLDARAACEMQGVKLQDLAEELETRADLEAGLGGLGATG